MTPPQLSGTAPGGYAARVGDVLTALLTKGFVDQAASAGAAASRKQAVDSRMNVAGL